MKKGFQEILYFLLLSIMLCVYTACNTTSHLPEGEPLYTGVKKLEIIPTDKEKLPEGMLSSVKSAINVPPNNPMPFMSPYMRTPFPIKLWIYNNYGDSAKGLKGWLYKHFSEPPVLISDVRPEVRTYMIEEILDNNGYFGSTATNDLLYNKTDPKKAKILYNVRVSSPYSLDSIIYINNKNCALCNFIDSLARKSDYLKKGEIFCVDSLTTERVRIANRLRNKGYYYFRPEYIEYDADSLLNPHHIALRLRLASNIPEIAKLAFKVGDITTVLNRCFSRYYKLIFMTSDNKLWTVHKKFTIYFFLHIKKALL